MGAPSFPLLFLLFHKGRSGKGAPCRNVLGMRRKWTWSGSKAWWRTGELFNQKTGESSRKISFSCSLMKRRILLHNEMMLDKDSIIPKVAKLQEGKKEGPNTKDEFRFRQTRAIRGRREEKKTEEGLTVGNRTWTTRSLFRWMSWTTRSSVGTLDSCWPWLGSSDMP